MISTSWLIVILSYLISAGPYSIVYNLAKLTRGLTPQAGNTMLIEN